MRVRERERVRKTREEKKGEGGRRCARGEYNVMELLNRKASKQAESKQSTKPSRLVSGKRGT